MKPEVACPSYMSIGEVAAQVLRETNNPAVMRYDSGLIHRIAEAADGSLSRVSGRWSEHGWKTEQRVIRALRRNPGPLVACWTRGPRNRPMLIFYLPEHAPPAAPEKEGASASLAALPGGGVE